MTIHFLSKTKIAKIAFLSYFPHMITEPPPPNPRLLFTVPTLKDQIMKKLKHERSYMQKSEAIRTY